MLIQRGNEIGKEHVHAVSFTLQKELAGELGDGPGLAEKRCVLVSELSYGFAFGARNILRPFTPSRDIDGGRFIKLSHLAHQISVQSATQSLVRAHKDD